MLGIIGKIFGSDKVIEKGFELIDEAWTTEAESLEARAKAKVDVMNAYAPFKVAQRVLAIMFTSVFLFCFCLVLGMTLSDKGNTSEVFNVLDQFKIGWTQALIVGFYFGGGAIESFKKR